jgi:hypothetical protein
MRRPPAQLSLSCGTRVAGRQQLPCCCLIADEAGNVRIEALANRVSPEGRAAAAERRQFLFLGDTGGTPGTLGDEPGRRLGVVRDGKRGAPLCRPRRFATFRSGDIGPRPCRDRRPEALRRAHFVARRSSAGGQAVGGLASHRVRSSRWANGPLQMPLRTRLTTKRCDLRHTSGSRQRDLRPRTKIR